MIIVQAKGSCNFDLSYLFLYLHLILSMRAAKALLHRLASGFVARQSDK